MTECVGNKVEVWNNKPYDNVESTWDVSVWFSAGALVVCMSEGTLRTEKFLSMFDNIDRKVAFRFIPFPMFLCL